ncbi:hypothetical protein ACSDR0_32575, partial [Streptosporangium sp. G11]
MSGVVSPANRGKTQVNGMVSPADQGGTQVSGVVSPANQGDARVDGVVLRELHSIEEFEDVFRLFDDIWHPDAGGAPVTVEMMRALSHAGNYVAGAYEGGTLVGASVGFLGTTGAERVLHSHITGALAGRGIGFALKLHQRAWALERG